MQMKQLMATGFVALSMVTAAQAAVTPEEAKQLGTTLTAFGAEKAGNADGSIPEYKDEAMALPAGYKPGSGRMVEVFADEKPLYTIDAKNMDQYADNLTEGAKTLMQRFPDFRIPVYPTHRTMRYPDRIKAQIAKNAVSAKLTGAIDGDGVADFYGAVPFPIPKSGTEVLWNTYLGYRGLGAKALDQNWLVDGSGGRTDLARLDTTFAYMYAANDPEKPYTDAFHTRYLPHFVGPAARAGTQVLFYFSRDYSKQDQLVHSYTPGLRRVRVAPEFSYDTPASDYGGAVLYDEVNMYVGRPDRYEMKLVGKKEIIVPYNTNKIQSEAAVVDKVLGKNFINPDFVRWEKHRVWVVEATLRTGKRHIFPKRTFYVDEDTWSMVAYDNYDQNNKPYHVVFLFSFVIPETGLVNPLNNFMLYNLNKNSYLIAQWPGGGSQYFVKSTEKLPDLNTLTPDAIQGSGIQ